MCVLVNILLVLLCSVGAVEGLQGKRSSVGWTQKRQQGECNLEDGCKGRSIIVSSAAPQKCKGRSSHTTIVSPAAPQGGGTATTLTQKLASVLGYSMASLALALYLPIILSILRAGNADGISIATWISNCLSFSLAMLYSIKKGYPISTYVEVIGLNAQAFVVLGLACWYKGIFTPYLVGSSAVIAAFGLTLTRPIPDKVLSSIQATRVAIDGYSLLPQILLNYQQSKFSYSEITASASAVGNLIRVFTTLTLVKDPLVLAGYVMGAASNIVLLLQFFFYRR